MEEGGGRLSNVEGDGGRWKRLEPMIVDLKVS